jgi:hypothetical protein
LLEGVKVNRPSPIPVDYPDLRKIKIIPWHNDLNTLQ